MVEQLTSGDFASHRALDSDGKPVMLHMSGDANRTTDAVASMLANLVPEESAKVREVLEVDGSVVAVTAEITPFVSFEAWIAASGDQEPESPSAEPGSAAANQPGVYTSIFQSLDTPSAPSPLTPSSEASPASPPAPRAVVPPVDEAPSPLAAPPPPAQPDEQPGPVTPPVEGPGMYTQIMQVGDLEPRPGRAERPVTGPPSTDLSGAPPADPSSSPPVIRWRPDEHRESPLTPSPGHPPAAGSELDVAQKGPPPIPDPVIRWQQPSSPAPGGGTAPSPATSAPAPSLPDAYNLQGGPKGFRPRVPDAASETSPVKPLEDPAAGEGPAKMFDSAPDYVDRLRTPPPPPPSSGAPPPAPPPLPNPVAVGPSEYTMIIKGLTPQGSSGPMAPTPQPPPPAPVPIQPLAVRRPSRVPLVIGLVVVAVILVALVLFVALRGTGGAAGTG